MDQFRFCSAVKSFQRFLMRQGPNFGISFEGMRPEIEWMPSRMGIYSRDRLWDFGTPTSLLRFGPLSWPAKIRFGLTTLWLNRVADWRRYEQTTAREWMLRHGGRQVFDTVWGPLLRQKFAERADDVAMVWLWGKVYLRGRSRSASGLGERLGYMRGSFGRLVTALVEGCMAAGVRLELACPVRRMRRAEEGVEVIVADAGSRDATRDVARRFGAAVLTSPAAARPSSMRRRASRAAGICSSCTRTPCSPRATAIACAECDVLGAGYQYVFSKRTNVMLSYAEVNNDANAWCKFGAGAAFGSRGQDLKGFGVGVRHYF